MDFQNMLQYCAALAAHNDRDWFHQNHDWYDRAKADFLALLEHLRFPLAAAAPAISSDLLYTPAKDWMYRVARDMRYYRDRPPYEPAFRAYLAADRHSWQPSGYFLRIAPGESVYGIGLWCEGTAATNRVRDFLALHQEEFEALIRDGELTMGGSRLKTVPRGYAPDHPAAQWLRYKDWMVNFDLPDDSLDGFDAFADRLTALTARLEPMRQFLMEAARAAT